MAKGSAGKKKEKKTEQTNGLPKQEKSEKEFYTVKEIAANSGLSYGTIKRSIDHGDLPAYRIGRKYFIDKSAGDRFCKENYTSGQVEGYTIKEIMEKIPLSYAFLMELVKTKQLPTTKRGRQYIVSYEDYEAFIQKSKVVHPEK